MEKQREKKIKPDPNLEKQRLAELQAAKTSVTGKMVITKNLTIYDLNSTDATTGKIRTLRTSVWKDTGIKGKPWYGSGPGGQSTFFKTRREAVQWALEQQAKLDSVDTKAIDQKYRRIRSTVLGDDRSGSSGRFAALTGVDFVELSAYDPTYGLLLNRSKTLVQKTKASSTTP